jgi:hypothetical protein
MIYLFDNCYLSTPNQIVETCKHIWIGSHEKLDDPYFNKTYDVYKTYNTITSSDLDDLFNEIHDNFSSEKVIIYCDVTNFQVVYSSFFGAILSEDGLNELYKYDRLKENYAIGSKVYGMAVTGFKSINTIDLPEELTISAPTTFLCSDHRIEIAFANYVAGDETKKEYCVSRICQMYDGTPGFWSKYVEQNLPAFIDDADYTMQNLLNPEYLQSVVDKYDFNELVPNSVLPLIKEDFNFDYLNHFFNVINDNNLTEDQYLEYWTPVSAMTKEEFVETRIMNTSIPIKFNLLFPNLSNFDSVNPILWNKIFEKCNDSEWLSKFEVNDGTDNQTDGTV